MPNNNNNNTRKPACKFYAQGACLKGENCKFQHHHHHSKHPPKNICKFYQQGFCPFASHCKYQHVLTSWINKSSSTAAASSSSTAPPLPTSNNTCANNNMNTHCLPPHRVLEETASEQNQEHLKVDEALRCSQEIECSVCLDRVLSKPTGVQRRFAVLPECDHPFCISCIRKWRKSSPNSAVRACPVCRKPSSFIVPSSVWYSSQEEKQEIIHNYKANLRSIDCKHFDFGNGNCPFGVNCFYKHTVKPGSYTWKYQRPPPRRPVHHRSNVVDMDASFDLFEHLIEEDFLAFSDAEDFYEDILEHLNDEGDDDEFDIYDACGFYDEEMSPFDMALLFAQLDPSDLSGDGENSLS